MVEIKFKQNYELSVEIIIDVESYKEPTPDKLGNPEFAEHGEPEEVYYTLSMVDHNGAKILAPDFFYHLLHEQVMEDIRDRSNDQEQDSYEQKMESTREKINE